MPPCLGFGTSQESLGKAFGGPWAGSWGSLGVLGSSQGMPTTRVYLLERPGVVLGGSWGVFEGVGRHWVSPMRSNYCSFIDFEVSSDI